ncbi:MAG TPA: hypothetical protein PK431_08295 [Chitinophagales bacterium]|nr:hypothetical protein [Chitinophagales bacterium]
MADYNEILNSHIQEKMPEYEQQTLILSKEYINSIMKTIALNNNQQFYVDVDRGLSLYFPTDAKHLMFDKYLWQLHPIAKKYYNGLIPVTDLYSHLVLPSYTVHEYNVPNKKDTQNVKEIFEYYYSIIRSEQYENKDSLTGIEIKNIYQDVTKMINPVKDSVLKILLLYQLELFVFCNNNHKWSDYYFYEIRFQWIENLIKNLNTSNQIEAYYFLGRMISDLGLGGDDYKYRYRMFFKSFYNSIFYKENTYYGIESLCNLHYTLSLKSDSYYFRFKRLDLLSLASGVYSHTNKADSINVTALRYLSIIYNVEQDSFSYPEKQTRNTIIKYTMLELVKLLNYARVNNIALHYRIGAICHYEIGIRIRSLYNNNLMSATYNGLSYTYTIMDHGLSHQFIIPLNNIVDDMFALGNLEGVRREINEMMYYSGEINSANYIGQTLTKYLYYFNRTKDKDSVYYVKSLIDSLLYNNELQPYTIYNNYVPALNELFKWYKDSSVIQQINDLNSAKQSDYTVGYSEYTKIEQNTIAEIYQSQNLKNQHAEDELAKQNALLIKEREYSADLNVKNDSLRHQDSLLRKINIQLEYEKNEAVKQKGIAVENAVEKGKETVRANANASKAITNRNYAYALFAIVLILLGSAIYLWRKEKATNKRLQATNIELEVEKEEKIEATKQAALYESNFFKDIIDFHPHKSGLPSISAKINWLKIKVDDMWDKITKIELSNDLDKIVDIVNHYTLYMENLLRNSKEKEITLQQEILSCQQYIDFVKLSSEKNIAFDYSGIVGYENLLIPPNILIPFVENCNRHAFKNKSISKNLISIHLNNNGNGYDLVCKDNGSGITKLSDTKGSGASLFSLQKFLSNYNVIENTNYYFNVDDISCRNNIIENNTVNGSFVKIKNITNG